MNPIKLDVIEKKSQILSQELKVLAEVQRRWANGSNDRILQHALCHSMQVSIAAIVDIAQHIVAEKLDKTPESYSESIRALAEAGILEAKFADSFSRVAKLRNVLVHLYDNIDIDFLYSLTPAFVSDVKKFLEQVAKKVVGV